MDFVQDGLMAFGQEWLDAFSTGLTIVFCGLCLVFWTGPMIVFCGQIVQVNVAYSWNSCSMYSTD